jgi:hypothetical protein
VVFFDKGQITVDASPKEAFARLKATGLVAFVPPTEVVE